jgi:hypothetical protein
MSFLSSKPTKGYYLYSIDFTNNTIELSNEQPYIIKNEDNTYTLQGRKATTFTTLEWTTEEIKDLHLTFKVFANHDCFGPVIECTGTTVKLSSLPFNKNAYQNYLKAAYDAQNNYAETDFFVFVTENPSKGSVQLKQGYSFSLGLDNSAYFYYTFSSGRGSIASGMCSSAIGRNTKALAYAA